jgi:hypothetical protein
MVSMQTKAMSSPFGWLLRIMSPCFFIGHDEPIKVLKRSQLHFECPRCGIDLGVVLKGQQFKARQPQQQPLRLIRLRRVG